MTTTRRHDSTLLTPESDAAAIAQAISPMLRTWKRIVAAAGAIGVILGALGFRAIGPSARLDRVEHQLAGMDSLRAEVADVKAILCAMAQPTGQAAAEKCIAPRRTR